MLESVLNHILKTEATKQLQAEPYERIDKRQGYRNGSYPHNLITRVGTLALRIPRLHSGQFSTEMFARYQRSKQALVIAMMAMVINGTSNRKVPLITKELCGAQFSKSTVSEPCKNLDPLVESWNHYPLTETYPFVVVDAMVAKVRKDGSVRYRDLLLAFGVNSKGYRELSGLPFGDCESEVSWSEFFLSLKQRGLKGLELIVSDQHSGLTKSIRTHFTRGYLAKMPDSIYAQHIGQNTESTKRRALLQTQGYS